MLAQAIKIVSNTSIAFSKSGIRVSRIPFFRSLSTVSLRHSRRVLNWRYWLRLFLTSSQTTRWSLNFFPITTQTSAPLTPAQLKMPPLSLAPAWRLLAAPKPRPVFKYGRIQVSAQVDSPRDFTRKFHLPWKHPRNTRGNDMRARKELETVSKDNLRKIMGNE